MKTPRARVIHAYRSSGLNPSGYSRPPAPPQQPADPWGDLDGHAVSLGRTRGAERVQARVNAAPGVLLGDPPRVPAGDAVIAVHLDGVRVRVPTNWGIALSSARGRNALHLREPDGALHVLVLDRDGELRELHGLPDDLVRDLVAQHFPRGGR